MSKHKTKWPEANGQRVITATIERWVCGEEWNWTESSSSRHKPGPWRENAITLARSATYNSWYTSKPGSPARFLWTIGTMGTENSVLMNEIVWQHRNHRRDGAITVGIYFDIRDPFFRVEFFMCLLGQILPQVNKPTKAMIRTHDEIQRGNIPAITEAILLELLKELTAEYDIYFFLDGLEELADEIIKVILDSLTSLGSRHRVICFSGNPANVHRDKFPNFCFWELPDSGSNQWAYQ